MEKSIYDLLNEVKMDEREYEENELSSQEKDRKKQEILKEVRKMEKERNKTTRKKVKIMGAVAAFAVVIGTAGVANPSLAKELFSNTFGKLIENSKGTKNEEEDTALYTTIGKGAVDVKEEVEKSDNGEAYITTAENNGVSISVSDVYCDGYVLYYTATLKTDDAGLNQADWVHTTKKSEAEYMVVNGVNVGPGTGTSFEKMSDGTFVKTGQIDLMNLTSEDGQLVIFDSIDSFDVDYVLKDLAGSDADAWDEQGEYVETGEVEGEWKLKFPVTVDRSQNEIVSIDKEENGIKLTNAVKTKAGLVLEVETPDFRKEPYNDSYNDPDIAIKDSQGKSLQWLSGSAKENQDGTAIYRIMVLYDGQTDLTLEVTNKNVDGNEIASIDFRIQ